MSECSLNIPRKKSRHKTNSIDRDGAAQRPSQPRQAFRTLETRRSFGAGSGSLSCDCCTPSLPTRALVHYGKRDLPSCATRMNPSPAGSCGVAARRVWGDADRDVGMPIGLGPLKSWRRIKERGAGAIVCFDNIITIMA
ncbi:hypothetical protein RB213_016038 [Colletotrichum asianum]